MPKMKMKVIPEPAPNTRVILRFAPGKAMLGDGDTDLLCGTCSEPLAKCLHSSTQANNVVFQCTKCGAFNDSGVPTN